MDAKPAADLVEQTRQREGRGEGADEARRLQAETEAENKRPGRAVAPRIRQEKEVADAIAAETAFAL